MARIVIWMPWAGHNARLLAERERLRGRYFGWSQRDPTKYVPALPALPLFYSPWAAFRAASEAVRMPIRDGVSSKLAAGSPQSQSKASGRSFEEAA